MEASFHGAVFVGLAALARACVVHEEHAPPPPAPVTVAAAPQAAAPPPSPPPQQASPPAPTPPTPPAQSSAKTPAEWTPGSVKASSPAPLGCFRDQGDAHGTSGRDLDGYVANVPAMTTEMCSQTCATKGFPLMATQFGTWCFCGTSYGKSGHAENCDMKCGGNKEQTCGGTWANSVYQIRPGPLMAPSLPATQAAASAVNLGCFRDQGDPQGTTGRDLSGFAENIPGMTTAMCTQACASRGFPFAATQFSTWCFCGTRYGRTGRAYNCNMKCGGNPNETCGGVWANSVYQLGQ
jgi:hypothetical protein